jgi:hypothetical protein
MEKKETRKLDRRKRIEENDIKGQKTERGRKIMKYK